MTTVKAPGGDVTFAFDVKAVRDLYDAYLDLDLSRAAERLAAAGVGERG